MLLKMLLKSIKKLSEEETKKLESLESIYQSFQHENKSEIEINQKNIESFRFHAKYFEN